MKNKFSLPIIMLSEPTPTPGGEGGVIGGGSNQGGTNIIPGPMSFSDWQSSQYAGDYFPDEGITINDFGVWWIECGFTEAEWVQAGNRAQDWNPEAWGY